MEKCKFHQYKKLLCLEDVDIDNIIISNKVSFGKKGFKQSIDFKDYVKSLAIITLQIRAGQKSINQL